jgi:hypothetical protein
MTVGHVTIDGREYVAPDVRQIVRSNANQVAAKIGSSAGDYDDLQNWNAWVLDNWQLGVGEKDPETGGFLFGTAETRFENQLLLPLHKQHVSSGNNDVGQITNGESFLQGSISNGGQILTIGVGQTYTKLADRFIVTGTRTLTHIDLLLPGKPTTATQFTVEIWSDNVTAPLALLETATVTLNGELGHSWYSVNISNLSPVGNTTYWLIIYPATSTANVITSGTGGWGYNGSSWVSGIVNFAGFYHENLNAIDASISNIVEFNSRTYIASTTNLYTINDTEGIDLLRTCAATITDLLAVGDKLYIGQGNTADYETMNTSEAFDTTPAVPARLWALHNGFLWRAVSASVYYTSDETTWTQVEVANSGYSVRGMAGFGDDMIVSTDDALYRIAYGDIVRVITRWGTIDSDNGKYMLNFQGNLYISVGKSLLRYDGASLLPMGVDLGEGLPYSRYGDIVGLTSNNNWLVCGIQGGTYSTCWAHNGQGWHFLSELPKGVHLSTIRYVATGRGSNTGYLNRLLMGTTTGPLYRLSLPDTARSTLRLAEEDSNYFFELVGVLETDWFYGSLREVSKDFESVYGDGDNFDSREYIEIYWQDEGSSGVWESLGTIDSDSEELRWSSSATRPNTRRLKLKLVLISLRYFESPSLSAVRVKYMPMIVDRWRWQIPILVSEDQELIDGTLQTTYTVAQQVTHLDGLTKQVAPFIFTDTDGTSYEVKVINASRNVTKMEYYNSAKQVNYVYNLVLEQVQRDAYSP